jgi:D-glycero-D-manno-heptose 1,7-bisphosphate phosphatase
VRAVILDRDGVINHDSADFIKSPSEWHPITGSLDAIAALCHAGFAVLVLSNQSGIARGLLSQESLDAIHTRLHDELARRKASLAGVWICPHAPQDGCDCRKPKPGLFFKASKQLGFELKDTPAIGDSLRDLDAAAAAGARPVLVRTGNGRTTERSLGNSHAIPVFDDLAHAAAALIQESRNV